MTCYPDGARPNDADDHLLSVYTVADLLRCTPAAIWKLMREGDMPSIKRGRRRFIRRSVFEAWLREHTR